MLKGELGNDIDSSVSPGGDTVMLQKIYNIQTWLATISLGFCGVVPGSAFKKKGVQRLLDATVNYLPSPIDVPAMKGQNADGGEDDTERKPGRPFQVRFNHNISPLVYI